MRRKTGIVLIPRATTVLLLVAWLLCAASNAFAQREVKDVPPPDPELERKALQVADGFEIQLWAADPMLAKPIQINFDPQGRMWVATSEVYPQISPGQQANDKILILEDTHHTGHADKTTIFADGLLIPTGVAPGDGGAYVANSTELLHFTDRGDGHAEQRRVMLSGFGTEDTHHILHTLRWGSDGMLYMNQSIYIHSHIETPWGPRVLNAGGIWQFRPETMELGVFARGWANPWGHEFDRWGQSFVTDGAGGEGINYCVPGGRYTNAADSPRTIPGLNPGSPKDCGLAIASGRNMPDDWRGNLITNDFRAHRVCRYVVTESGSGYVSREMPELVKTNHQSFRPIDVKMGPDGAIYIADWFNPIIQHGEVDFRDPRRDHTHGRIWRVSAKGKPALPAPRLIDAKDDALLDSLKSPEDWTRQQAHQVIKERGSRMLPALAIWVARLDGAADPESDHQRLEALWAYQSLRRVEPGLLRSLLHSPDHHVRAAAVRVLSYWHDEIPDALSLLGERVADEHPQVRLEAVRACAQIPTTASAEVALRALDRPTDRFLEFTLWQTARDMQDVWLPAVQAGQFDFGRSSRHLIFALEAVGNADAVKPLLELFHKGGLPPERIDSMLQLVAEVGTADELNSLFTLALDDAAPAARRQLALSGLVAAASVRHIAPPGDLGHLANLLDAERQSLEAQMLAARLAGLWKVNSLRARLNELATASGTPSELRTEALESLIRLRPAQGREVLDRMLAAEQPFATRAAAASALVRVDLPAGAARVAELLATAPATVDPAPLVNELLGYQKGPATLAAAIFSRKLPPDIAKLAIRAVRATGSDQPELVAALNKAGGLKISGPRMPRADELKKLIAAVRTDGDPARGEAVFRRGSTSCLKCHAIGGVGSEVGPDLVSIGASAQVDYLIESILDPSAKIKEGYQSLVITTNSGRLYTGIKVRKTDHNLILRDADGHEIEIPLASIDDGHYSPVSLMPVGLADDLTRQEFVDLVRFLSELGKVGPYALSKTPTARRWQAVVATPAARALLKKPGGLDRAAADDPALTWTSVYGKVSGELPLADLAELNDEAGAKISVVRCQIDVTNPGDLEIRPNALTGLKMWLDGRPLDLAEHPRTSLKEGQHTLMTEVLREQRQAPLRIELPSVQSKGPRGVFVGGR